MSLCYKKFGRNLQKNDRSFGQMTVVTEKIVNRPALNHESKNLYSTDTSSLLGSDGEISRRFPLKR